MSNTEASKLVKITRDYYDSEATDAFYHTIWGGEDIHIGIYQNQNEPIALASARTIEKKAKMLEGLNPDTQVLDIGSGYGGAARWLAKHKGCYVTCLNLSETENARNREKNTKAGLEQHISIVQGNFEALPFADAQFDVVWSEDAILHSDNKPQVFREVTRILKPSGQFIFTDPMQSDDCPEGVLQPVLDRIHLKALGSFKLYKHLASETGLKTKSIIDFTTHLTQHYTTVKRNLSSRYEEMMRLSGRDYTDRMLKGLDYWIEASRKGYLAWGILHFRKDG